jgi:hypothetical protein
MNVPIEFWIYLAASLGATFGFFIGGFLAGAKRQRVEKHTWNQARIFYAKLHAEPREPRL